MEATAISLGTLSYTITGQTGDSNSLNTLTISGAPAGAILSDGTHNHTSAGTGDLIDVSTWTLSSLKITPTNDANFTPDNARPQPEKDADGNISTSTTATEVVTVNPTAPTESWAATATGVENAAISAGCPDLHHHQPDRRYQQPEHPDDQRRAERPRRWRRWRRRSQCHLHWCADQRGAGWTFNEALKVTPDNNDLNFTLTATATEKDGDGDISTTRNRRRVRNR